VAAVATGAALGSFVLPNRYKSEATILVQEQQVPERYVVPNSTTDLDQALRTMTHDVLSRPRLLEIMSELKLYPRQREGFSPEQLVELMRGDINIEALESQNPGQRTTNAFTISYVGSNPGTVQEVTEQLTSLFINEDLKSQERRDVTTTNFLQNQLAAAQSDLERKEKHLRDFKMANLGELPEQREGNLQILSGFQEQLRNANASLTRANEQRAYLESLLAQYQNLTIASGSGSSSTTGLSPLDMARTELIHLQTKRAALLGTLTKEHPDVKEIDHEITKTQELLAELQAKALIPNSDASSASVSGGVTPTDATTAQLNSQLKENQLEASHDAEQTKQLQQQIDEYQHRLNLTPVREQQLMDLLRDYDLAKKNYDDLYAKKTQSALATDLGKDQQGEQFRLIEPPNRPNKPFAPNRPKSALSGLAIGVVLGIAVAALIETRDASLHTEKELHQYFDFPIVAALPLLLSSRERRLQSLDVTLQWCACTVILLGIIAMEYYVYRRG